ncbi:MAG: AlpA family phage regulatory protein [Verrucomicrobiota bacterium]
MKASLPSEGFVKLDVVLQHVPYKKTQWYQGIREGVFPESYPVPFSKRGVCWDVDDIRKVIEEIRLHKQT